MRAAANVVNEALSAVVEEILDEGQRFEQLRRERGAQRGYECRLLYACRGGAHLLP